MTLFSRILTFSTFLFPKNGQKKYSIMVMSHILEPQKKGEEDHNKIYELESNTVISDMIYFRDTLLTK